MTKKNKAELIKQLRKELQVTKKQVSDSELLEKTEGTVVRIRVELGIALINFCKTIAIELPILKKLLG